MTHWSWRRCPGFIGHHDIPNKKNSKGEFELFLEQDMRNKGSLKLEQPAKYSHPLRIVSIALSMVSFLISVTSGVKHTTYTGAGGAWAPPLVLIAAIVVTHRLGHWVISLIPVIASICICSALLFLQVCSIMYVCVRLQPPTLFTGLISADGCGNN